jgi:hypothetical protein
MGAAGKKAVSDWRVMTSRLIGVRVTGAERSAPRGSQAFATGARFALVRPHVVLLWPGHPSSFSGMNSGNFC